MQAVPNPADDRDYYIRVMMRRFRSTYKAVHHHEPSEEREKKLVGRLANIPSASLAILNDISIYDGVAFSSCLTSLGLEPAETA
jgi:hypothetical protein